MLTFSLVLVLILPVYKVWGLQMVLCRKVPLIGIFLLGILVSIVGLIRLKYLTLVWTIPPNSTNLDVTCMLVEPRSTPKSMMLMHSPGHYAPVWYWAIIEAHVGVLSACLPVLRPIQTRAASYLSSTKLHYLLFSGDKESKIAFDSSKHNLTSRSNESQSSNQHPMDCI